MIVSKHRDVDMCIINNRDVVTSHANVYLVNSKWWHSLLWKNLIWKISQALHF